MLASMDTAMDSATDPHMINRIIQASTSVSINSEQMPLDNQVRSCCQHGQIDPSLFRLLVGNRSEYHRKGERSNEGHGIGR